MVETLLRDKARVLRMNGRSLNEIAQYLKIPKSTVRYWCRDIILSRKQIERLFGKQKLGGILAAEKLRRERLHTTKRLLQKGISVIADLSNRELLLVGSALYWAEGYRKGNGEFGFTNSDPRMICLIIRWLKEVCGVDKNRIRPRLCINVSHRGKIAKIQKFWSEITEISLSQFAKPTIINIKNKKRYLNSSEYFGTLRVKVRNGTNLKREILGWIEGLARNALAPM